MLFKAVAYKFDNSRHLCKKNPGKVRHWHTIPEVFLDSSETVRQREHWPWRIAPKSGTRRGQHEGYTAKSNLASNYAMKAKAENGAAAAFYVDDLAYDW